MRTPRLLPLAAVAIGGVLAAKALGAVDGLPAMLASAQAAAPAPHAKPAAAPQAVKPGVSPLPPAAKLAAPAPGVCAPTAAELAKEAGLSPAELQMLQSLGARRGQLDAREQALDAQVQLLNAASLKIDAKIKALNAAKAQVEALVGQADVKTQAEVDRLVVVYEKMKPKDAGAIFAALDDKVRVPVAAKIAGEKPAILSAILAQMGTLEAKKLTESLAHRFDAARAAAEAAQNPTAKGGGKIADAGAAAADAKPIQVASVDPTAAPDAGESKPAQKAARKAASRRPAAKAAKPPEKADAKPADAKPSEAKSEPVKSAPKPDAKPVDAKPPAAPTPPTPAPGKAVAPTASKG